MDRKVNQHLVSATYLAETEVLRTGHIGKIQNSILHIGKIQLVVYYQCCVLIG